MGMNLLEKLSPYMYDKKAVKEITDKHYGKILIAELETAVDLAYAARVAAHEYYIVEARSTRDAYWTAKKELEDYIEELQHKEEIPVAFNEYHTNHTHLGGAE